MRRRAAWSRAGCCLCVTAKGLDNRARSTAAEIPGGSHERFIGFADHGARAVRRRPSLRGRRPLRTPRRARALRRRSRGPRVRGRRGSRQGAAQRRRARRVRVRRLYPQAGGSGQPQALLRIRQPRAQARAPVLQRCTAIERSAHPARRRQRVSHAPRVHRGVGGMGGGPAAGRRANAARRAGGARRCRAPHRSRANRVHRRPARNLDVSPERVGFHAKLPHHVSRHRPSDADAAALSRRRARIRRERSLDVRTHGGRRRARCARGRDRDHRVGHPHPRLRRLRARLDLRAGLHRARSPTLRDRPRGGTRPRELPSIRRDRRARRRKPPRRSRRQGVCVGAFADRALHSGLRLPGIQRRRARPSRVRRRDAACLGRGPDVDEPSLRPGRQCRGAAVRGPPELRGPLPVRIWIFGRSPDRARGRDPEASRDRPAGAAYPECDGVLAAARVARAHRHRGPRPRASGRGAGLHVGELAALRRSEHPPAGARRMPAVCECRSDVDALSRDARRPRRLGHPWRRAAGESDSAPRGRRRWWSTLRGDRSFRASPAS